MRTVLENSWHEPGWCVRKLGGLGAEFLSILFLERGKSRRLRFFLLGLKHGWQGKMGPPSDRLPYE
jgi:hypothetical protein